MPDLGIRLNLAKNGGLAAIFVVHAQQNTFVARETLRPIYLSAVRGKMNGATVVVTDCRCRWQIDAEPSLQLVGNLLTYTIANNRQQLWRGLQQIQLDADSKLRRAAGRNRKLTTCRTARETLSVQRHAIVNVVHRQWKRIGVVDVK